MPEPWRLEMGIITASDGTLFMQQMAENTQRILACVNAMEGIQNPMAFIKQYNESKRGKLILTQDQLQKLGEQYRNQEETPYIETSQLTGNITQESASRITQVAFADTPKEAEIAIYYMKKYGQLKEVIENMVDRLEEGGEMTLTKDSIIVHCLKEAIK